MADYPLHGCSDTDCFRLDFFREWRYITVIPIAKQEIPPVNRDPLADFRTFFEDRQVFARWLKENPMAQLTWEDMTLLETIGNFEFTKPEGSRYIVLTADRKKMGRSGDKLDLYFAVIINDRNIDKLTSLIAYAQFCEQYLSRFYADMTRRELDMLNNRFTSLASGPNDIISTDTMLGMVLPRENFLRLKDSGRSVLRVKPPLPPELVSPRPALTMVLALMLGGLLGGMIVLGRHYLRRAE